MKTHLEMIDVVNDARTQEEHDRAEADSCSGIGRDLSVIDGLIQELQEKCNRYKNGYCANLNCLLLGGYSNGDSFNYDVETCLEHCEIATCLTHQRVLVLERLTKFLKCSAKNP